MTNRMAIEDSVRRYLQTQVHVEVLSADADLFACGALDSLALVDLVVTLEEELGTRIPLDRLDVADFRSIARIAAALSTGEPGT